ncbi:MAG: DUF1385 domain-containing protein [Lachnospiraceae bacterium]|jgi:uncharacterized protein YqhQ|nr:DUF1385 domain-containing protein [Lachnospiraceae bacterium]
MANGQHYSGIGGQAVLEGIMMRNKNMIAVACSHQNGEIEVEVEEHHGLLEGSIWTKIPFVRGVFAFLDALITGISALNFSSQVYGEDEEEEKSAPESEAQERQNKVLMAVTTAVSLVLAVLLFMVLPCVLAGMLRGFLREESVLSLLEGLIRLVIFLGYMIAISTVKDIRRLYQYHGAEHKCINCIERGKPLTVQYVLSSSRFHKRCGTSFLVLVMLVSIILFFFVNVDSFLLRILTRILLVPVIAGICYEILHLAGRSDSLLVRIISAPGLWLQRITTGEPDAHMVEVAIAAVEAVFDWRGYLADEFGYDLAQLDTITPEAKVYRRKA